MSTLTVNPDDEEVERALKLAHIDMYTRRLTERNKKKRWCNKAEQYELV